MPSQIVSKFYEERYNEIIKDYFELLRFPTVGIEPLRLVDISRCAAWLKRHLQSIGFKAEIHLEGDQPIVLGERLGNGNAPTVLYYGHYDVQPADPLELWKTEPFDPQLIDGRVYARGAQDNKGQFFAFLTALKALIEAGQELPTIRILLESQEESGSGALQRALPKIRRKLAANVLLVGDTGMHSSGRFAITAGLRGIAHLGIELHGPSRDIHSGTHGGVAPNPATGMARMLASLHDASGRVAVPGFYDGVEPPTEEEACHANNLPFDAEEYLNKIGVPPVGGEEGLSAAERSGFEPTLEINGVHSGYGGPGSKTIIPAVATAKVSMRLVPGQSPEATLTKVLEHLKDNTPRGLRLDIVESHVHGPGLRLPLSSPLMRLASAALEEMSGEPPFYLWEGASVPIVAELHKQTGAAPLLVGFGHDDDRIHSPNESFSLEQFKMAMRFSAIFLTSLVDNDKSK